MSTNFIIKSSNVRHQLLISAICGCWERSQGLIALFFITVKTTPPQTTQIKIHPDVIPTNSPNRTFQPDHYYCQDNTAADDTNQHTSRRHSNKQSQQNIPARSLLLSRQHRRRRHKSRYIQTSFQQTVPTEHSSQIIITVKTTPLQTTQIKIHPDVIPTNSPNRTFQPDHYYCQDNTAADDTNHWTTHDCQQYATPKY